MYEIHRHEPGHVTEGDPLVIVRTLDQAKATIRRLSEGAERLMDLYAVGGDGVDLTHQAVALGLHVR